MMKCASASSILIRTPFISNESLSMSNFQGNVKISTVFTGRLFLFMQDFLDFFGEDFRSHANDR